MSITFKNEWVRDAVEKILEKPKTEREDLCSIKYLAIGESFDNDFFIQMSLAVPPQPFVNKSGGDEWRCACFKKGEDPAFVKKYVEEFENKKSITLSTTSCKPDKEWSDYVSSDKAGELWKSFSESGMDCLYGLEQLCCWMD